MIANIIICQTPFVKYQLINDSMIINMWSPTIFVNAKRLRKTAHFYYC